MSVPKLENLDCKYGAPMGRRAYWPHAPRDSDLTEKLSFKLYLHRLEFTDGGYDQGGAYWGAPADVYRAIDEENTFCCYVRANSREEAMKKLSSEFPTFTFTYYRGARKPRAKNKLSQYLASQNIPDPRRSA